MRIVEQALRRLQRAAAWKLAHGAAALLAALAAAAAPMWRTAAAPLAQPAAALEWAALQDGPPLRPLALGEVEQRFAARFPGTIVRLTDDHRQWVLRQVHQPTRMLHPAEDCYRGLGWRTADARLEADAQGQRWRCFAAERAGARVRVCERIVDAQGAAFTDTSSWYWAALLGRSRGPWRAITVATPA